jgi:TRAP-type C4-dicarboxylate transport system permease small subunit
MRRDVFLLLLGSLVFLTPFLGVPESWKTVLLFVLGAIIVLLALVYRFEARQKYRIESPDASFAEHDPQTD